MTEFPGESKETTKVTMLPYQTEVKLKAGIMLEILGTATIHNGKLYFINNPFTEANIEELRSLFINGEIDGHKIIGIEYYAKACPPYTPLGLLVKKDGETESI